MKNLATVEILLIYEDYVTTTMFTLGKDHLIWQGGRGGNEDIEGRLRKFLDTRKGGSEKIRGGSENLYALNPKGGGAPKKFNR